MLDGLLAIEVETPKDKPDVAICSACGWHGPVDKCETEEEGDWETGYYSVHICPKCPEGGVIDDYAHSGK